jgi:O-acetyl-ADP-ribose deacetylase (regulator of RNase III)
MITTINKDILTVDKGVIVHSVNCIGAVGGLAGNDQQCIGEIKT